MQNSSPKISDTPLELACLAVRGCVYGVDVMQVREIVRSQQITPLPKAPALIEGLMPLRDAVIPVVDLGRALGGEPVDHGPRTRIAVVAFGDMVFGLRVGTVVDVLSVGVDALQEAPALATQAGYEAVRAVVRRPDGPPVMMLSLEHLVESIYRSALDSGSEP